VALTKAQKKDILDVIEKILKDSKSVAFAQYSGLTVAEVSEMRRTLKKAGVSYKVVKKSLAGKVLGGKKIEGTVPEMPGQIALAYSTDLIAPAREVFQAGKKYEGKISITGGIFEGKFMSKGEMISIASIPSRETLLGMFVNIINSPIQGLVLALDAVAKKKL